MDEYLALRKETKWSVLKERQLLFRFLLDQDAMDDFVAFCQEELALENHVNTLAALEDDGDK